MAFHRDIGELERLRLTVYKDLGRVTGEVFFAGAGQALDFPQTVCKN